MLVVVLVLAVIFVAVSRKASPPFARPAHRTPQPTPSMVTREENGGGRGRRRQGDPLADARFVGASGRMGERVPGPSPPRPRARLGFIHAIKRQSIRPKPGSVHSRRIVPPVFPIVTEPKRPRGFFEPIRGRTTTSRVHPGYSLREWRRTGASNPESGSSPAPAPP